jgi:hypothetical protein
MLNDKKFIDKIINGFKQFDNYIDNWCTLVRAPDLNIIYSSPLYNKVFRRLVKITCYSFTMPPVV